MIAGNAQTEGEEAGRIQIVSAYTNGLTIMLLALWIIVEAVGRILFRSGWTLVRDSGLVLLEGVPMHLDRNEAARDLERAVPDLQQVHHMRLGRTAASQPALAAIKERLRADHGIDHATVEVERSAERAG